MKNTGISAIYAIIVLSFRLGLAASVFVLASCSEGESDSPCDGEHFNRHFAGQAPHWFLAPFKPGDTVKFNVYRRLLRSQPYTYVRTEKYQVKDTGLQALFIGFCDETGDYLVASFSPGKIVCRVDYDKNARMYFQGRWFLKNVDLFRDHMDEWDDSVTIGGKQYSNVSLCKGYDTDQYPTFKDYTDSTYLFYNEQYGLLKFIINDTLIYSRQLP